MILLCSCSPGEGNRYTTWRTYNGDPGGTRYSRLDRITRGNVRHLQMAWEFHTGDRRKQPPSTIECTPVVVDSTMYLTSPGLKVFALNARTGRVRWEFDPFRGRSPRGVNRGVTYWAAGPDRRILFTAGPYLYALDAGSGTPVTAFGDSGRVDLRLGLDRDVGALSVTASSPGVIYHDLYITGSSVGEGPGPAAPGHIRAYDVRTGERRWIFHTIPHPGEPGYDTWPPEAWRTAGGANSWAGVTVDQKRGLVFVPTGSASYDHYGGDRPGRNLFANCLLALDAETGKRAWHFQAVHHDIWDYDLASPPALVTVQRHGRTIDAVAQPTKMGHLFLFDRTDGTPLFPIEERKVPQSDLPGEVTWPTQPFPVTPVPYAVQGFTPDLVTDLSPAAHDSVARRFRHFRSGRLFLPPSEQGTLTLPQFNGGTDWGGASFDPATQTLYVNTSDVAESITMAPSDPDRNGRLPTAGELAYRVNCAGCHGLNREGDGQSVPGLRDLGDRYDSEEVAALIRDGRGQMPAFDALGDSTIRRLTGFLLGGSGGAVADTTAGNGFVYPPYIATGHKPFRDPENYPANKPPWGTLNAIDLNTGEIKWQVPLGEHPELSARGIPPTGTFNMGGSIVTAGGLVFIGATKDARFRAFDAASGDILWEYPLDAGAYATPCTYAVHGRQFVVIAAGGGGKPGTASGDAYVAFALPAGSR
ncbi:MAG TPA: PQQ-binding-like beta-propeller repeat protein [Gammaproteobacteria bacterium]|nr:PQQ-binding-like beta-propeller repeat protein [Gammaproteobacteria bacterium]